jgi:hypothetical protein
MCRVGREHGAPLAAVDGVGAKVNPDHVVNELVEKPRSSTLALAWTEGNFCYFFGAGAGSGAGAGVAGALAAGILNSA